MQKKDLYFVLWIAAFMASAFPFFFLGTDGWDIPVMVSLAYKFGLGIVGTTAAVKKWEAFKEEKKAHRAVMVPFYIVALIVIQIVFITVFMAVTSSKQAIFEESSNLVAFAILIVMFLVGNYFWEIEFFRTIEQKSVRIAFAITTPFILFLSDAAFLVLAGFRL